MFEKQVCISFHFYLQFAIVLIVAFFFPLSNVRFLAPMAKMWGSLLAGGGSYWIGLGGTFVFLAIHISNSPLLVGFLWLIS